ARGNVVEDDTEQPAALAAHARIVHAVPTPEIGLEIFQTFRLARLDDARDSVKPAGLEVGKQRIGRFSNNVTQTGVALESVAHFPVAHPGDAAIVTLDHLRDAETFVDGVEQRPILFFDLAQRPFRLAAFGHVPRTVGYFNGERDLLVRPRAWLGLVQRQERDEASFLHKRHLQQRAYAEIPAAFPLGFGKRIDGFDIRDGEHATSAQRV